MTPRGSERGSATLVVLALSVALAAAGGLAATLGAVAVARHRAAAAADLAALAAADRALEGPAAACAAAERATRGVGAELTTCTLSGDGGDIADVVASVRPPGALGSWGVARSHSRAGPSRR